MILSILNVFKFVLAVLIVPLTVIVSISFGQSLFSIPTEYQQWFWAGVNACVLIHLFVYELSGVYQLGQQIVSSILGFWPSLSVFISRMVSFYVVLSVMFLCSVKFFFKQERYLLYGILLLSFSLSMHLIFTSRVLKEEDAIVYKPNYFLVGQLFWITNIFLLAIVMSLIFESFAMNVFWSNTLSTTVNFYSMVFHQLFVT